MCVCVAFENIISRDNILIEIETFCENFAIIVAAHFSHLRGGRGTFPCHVMCKRFLNDVEFIKKLRFHFLPYDFTIHCHYQ